MVQRISSATTFPGFRPGKAPYDVVAKRVGEQAIWEEALESIVQRAFVQQVRERKLKTVGQPQISVQKLAPGNPVVFTATVALLPSVELTAYDRFSVKRNRAPVTEEDVVKSLEDLRKIIAAEKPVDRPAWAGDRVEVDVDVFMDNVPVAGGQSRNHPATLGEGSFIPGFEEQVIGMTKGQAKEFSLQFPKEYHAKNLAGNAAQFKVTLRKVAELELPKLDDAFAKTVANLPSLEDLRKRLRNDLETQRQKRAEQDFEVKLLEELVKHSTFGDIPEVLVEHELDRIVHELRHNAEQRGMKYADYLSSMKKDEAALRTDLRPNALNRVKTALVIRAIAEKEGVGVSAAEIDAEIASARPSLSPEQLKEVGTEEFRDYVHTVLTNRKTLDAIKAKQPAV